MEVLVQSHGASSSQMYRTAGGEDSALYPIDHATGPMILLTILSACGTDNRPINSAIIPQKSAKPNFGFPILTVTKTIQNGAVTNTRVRNSGSGWGSEEIAPTMNQGASSMMQRIDSPY